MFRPELERAIPRSDGTKGGRPAFDPVLMFKVLLLQAMHAFSDERCEYLIRDRLSFMRFLGLGPADTVPDANTIWTHLSIDRRHRLIRCWTATAAAAHDAIRLGDLLDPENTASDVWADTAYRSANNEALLAQRGLLSRLHRQKPKGRPMAARTRRANAASPLCGARSNTSLLTRRGRWA